MRYVVARAEEIPTGGRKIVEVSGQSVGVFNVEGDFFALRNRCPHQGGPLCEGKLWGSVEASVPGEFRYRPHREILTCPWHGWEFDIRTGRSWCDPRRLRARGYDVSVVAGDLLVEGPYRAETVPVTVEGNYVVIKLDSERKK